jgi:hypothetical protein
MIRVQRSTTLRFRRSHRTSALCLCDLGNVSSGVLNLEIVFLIRKSKVLVQYDTNDLATLVLPVLMSTHTFTTLFLCIEPFKATLLSCLAPFDIAKLLAAIRYEPTSWERKTHMNILDDVFEDAAVFKLMIRRGLTVRIIGADVETLRMRLHYPCSYLHIPHLCCGVRSRKWRSESDAVPGLSARCRQRVSAYRSEPRGASHDL